MNKKIAISVVSHGQVELLNKYLESIVSCTEVSELVVTHNIPEEDLRIDIPDGVKLHIIKNKKRQGFGDNHNRAFEITDSEFFCVLNPDIWFTSNVFNDLISKMEINPELGLLSTLVLDKNGKIQDSFRVFPSIFNLFKKNIFSRRKPFTYPFDSNDDLIDSEWIAGMFMFFRSSVYRKISGFDEKFFLYCEDVDISLRIKKNNFLIRIHPGLQVYHDARRSSRKNIGFFVLHLKSFLRLYILYPYKAFKIT
jgi:N-acetylglucosaminyl-diphospho-decaprenol L-rhamnosyltransferase